MSPQLPILVWLLMTSAVVGVLEDNQYCTVRYRRLCQGKGRHIACQFPDIGQGPSCENYTAIKFTNDLKHFITHYINRRRQRIASGNERVRGGLHLPKPEVMMLVEWDRELAFLAQRLADQCTFVHDDCRATVRYPYAGQTVGEVRWRRSSESDELSAQRALRRVFDAWWGERRRVYPKQLTEPFRLTGRGAVWGHFTQLAVWTLRAVGCGAVRHGANYPRMLLVCDFSHTNMLGQRTFTPGHLAPCPIHTGRRSRSAYPLLCGPVRRSSPTEELRDNQQYDDDDDHVDDNDDEDSDDEAFMTVEVGEVPTPYLWVRKAYGSGANGERVVGNDHGLKFRDTTIKTTPRGPTIDVIQRELEMKVNTEAYNDVTFCHRTRRPDFGQWRYAGFVLRGINIKVKMFLFKENQENVEEVKYTSRKSFSIMDDEGSNEYLRPGDFQEPYSRQRWKQTRDKPRRPGANALLSSSTTKVVIHSRRPSIASLMLDKEDVDQLFQDTGFSMAWRDPILQRKSL